VKKLDLLLQKIKNIGGNFILWYSGGRDSRLLLESSIKAGVRPLLLCLDDGWSLEQKKYVYRTVRSHSLPLYSYSPWKAAVCRSQDDTIFLAALYAYTNAGHSFVVVKDLEHDPRRCSLELNIRLTNKTAPPLRSMKHVIGSRKTDRHPVFGDDHPLVKSEQWEHGGVSFHAPLYDWSSKDVIRALNALDVDASRPAVDTGSIPACFACLKAKEGETVFCPKRRHEIPAFAWDGQENAKIIRRFIDGDNNGNH
jgi:hypothetical protein